jgi:hypothetical protein
MILGNRKKEPIAIRIIPVPLFSLFDININPRKISNACQVNRKSLILQGIMSARSAMRNNPRNMRTIPNRRCALPDLLNVFGSLSIVLYDLILLKSKSVIQNVKTEIGEWYFFTGKCNNGGIPQFTQGISTGLANDSAG